jgi:hypothetical protein
VVHKRGGAALPALRKQGQIIREPQLSLLVQI